MSNELDRVRQFRSNEAPPSVVVREQARAALARVSEETAAGSYRQRGRSDRTGRRWRYGWLRPSVAVGLTVAVCIVAIELLGAGTDTGPSPALATTLRRLAQIAANGPSLVPGPGQYLYVDSEAFYPAFLNNTCITYTSDHGQAWTAANGSGMTQDTTGQTTFTSASDRAICAAMHLPARGSPGTSRSWFAAGCGELGPGEDMQALSTNPRTLLKQMRRIDGGPRTPGEDFVHIGDFLRGTDASPALRAALYRAAALIPGVRLLGTVRDHIGRTGLGVSYNAHGLQHELIFNARTSALMGEQDAGTAPGSTDWAVYLASRVVNRLPRQSPLPLRPACDHGAGIVRQTPQGTVDVGK